MKFAYELLQQRHDELTSKRGEYAKWLINHPFEYWQNIQLVQDKLLRIDQELLLIYERVIELSNPPLITE